MLTMLANQPPVAMASQAMGGVGLLIGTYDGLDDRPETMFVLKIVPGASLTPSLLCCIRSL